MIKIDDFRSVVSQYKVVFFDAFGVLKNYQGIIQGVEKTMAFLKNSHIDFYVLTNDASRSPEQLAEGYQALKEWAIPAERVISSGMLANDYLSLKVESGKVAYLGTESSGNYIQTVGLQTIPVSAIDLDHCDEVNALVFLDDEGFDWKQDINKCINLLRKRNIPVIVANTDDTYPVSRKEMAVAVGGIANMIEAITGKRFIRFGKPDTQIFVFAHEHIQNGIHDQTVGKHEILMVGDTLYTDILGGNKFGLDTMLVLSGNTLEKNAQRLIDSSGIMPDYICDSIVIE